MIESVSLNWGAILIAGVINMALGTLWYSPMVFGASWMKLVGVKEMKPDPKKLAAMFVTALLIAMALTHFVVYAGANTFAMGMQVGVLIAVGFVALVGISSTLASGTSWKLLAINAGYWVVSLAIMGGVLGALR